eukprot:scaffold2091_cov361-Prasinococcus_capsulatus_cf.AAC.2
MMIASGSAPRIGRSNPPIILPRDLWVSSARHGCQHCLQPQGTLFVFATGAAKRSSVAYPGSTTSSNDSEPSLKHCAPLIRTNLEEHSASRTTSDARWDPRYGRAPLPSGVGGVPVCHHQAK